MRDTHDHTKIPNDCLFCSTLNECEFCLLTPSVIVALPNAYLRDDVCKFVVSFPLDPVLVNTIKIIQYRTKGEQIKMQNI